MMLTFDPLLETRERRRRLYAEADAERLVSHTPARHVLADALRRAADRLDPIMVVPIPR
jgi:hypothetical protein